MAFKAITCANQPVCSFIIYLLSADLVSLSSGVLHLKNQNRSILMKNLTALTSRKKESFGQFRGLYGYRLFFLVLMGLWICLINAVKATGTENKTVNIGVVLDLNTMVGRKSLSILSLALNEFYSSHVEYQTRIKLHARDSKQDVVAAASAALDLIKNDNVEAIIGPEMSTQAHFMLSLGNKAQVPIISFSATSPSLSHTRYPYFLRAMHNDSAQVTAISSMVKHFSWREAVPVFAQDEYGEGIVPFLIDALQEVDCRVPYRSAIAAEATDSEIKKELRKLMNMETRVFIVHMMPDLGTRMFKNAVEVGMMGPGFVWIVSDGIGDMLSTMNSMVLESMQGVLGMRNHIPKSKELEGFEIRWRRKFQSENDILSVKLDIFGIRAHNAAVALAMAVEEVFSNRTETSRSEKTNVTKNMTDLDSIPVSKAGPSLREALLNLSFKGLAGTFSFLNGEVPPYAYQIVNVDENGGRGVGYWTEKGGISRFLNFNKTETDSQRNELGPVIWPGESRHVPKGWTIPVNGKKLRIGVPEKDGFLEFVKVTRDHVTNEVTEVSGYCIEVFEAVMKAMPYLVQYEYKPFAFPDGTSSGSYDDLTLQVFLGKLDAVVGDVTIVANRSLYVDFTLPYTESGVTMIVPIRDHSATTAWVFLKPLTWKLWFTSFCFFIFIGFVIWVLEHRTNEDFRGPPMYQIGTMFWFSFSTMVYAHREKVVSNLARFVVTVWVFVVLILIQTYTASLASMLTVQKLQPTVTDINELIRRGDKVGYQNGSFVEGLLKQMKFDQSKLINYNSLEELEKAFRKGSGNGGVAAVFDEIPYTRLFLGKHCSEYAAVGRTYKTDGFGFVFPKGSRLVPDVSRAILNVSQGEQMTAIENKWFGQQATCPAGSSASASSGSIGLDSFWGLFLIAGAASVSALIIYAAIFLYQHRQILSRFDNKTSWWNKVVVLSRQFDHKDMSSHTFKDISTGHIGSAGVSPYPKRSQDQKGFAAPDDSEAAVIPDQGDPTSTGQVHISPEPEYAWVTAPDIDDPPIQNSSQVPSILDSSDAHQMEKVSV